MTLKIPAENSDKKLWFETWWVLIICNWVTVSNFFIILGGCSCQLWAVKHEAADNRCTVTYGISDITYRVPIIDLRDF